MSAVAQRRRDRWATTSAVVKAIAVQEARATLGGEDPEAVVELAMMIVQRDAVARDPQPTKHQRTVNVLLRLVDRWGLESLEHAFVAVRAQLRSQPRSQTAAR